MKKLELQLKKELLIVDLENDSAGFINGDYVFLCDGSELTEEIASELVNSNDDYGVVMYQNYRTTSMSYFDEQITALESFISVIESKGHYWLDNPNYKTYFNPEEYNESEFLEFKEAEEKTFRNPLIFVKK